MRRLMLLAVTSVLAALVAFPAAAQDMPMLNLDSTSTSTLSGPSVVGSDGTLYQTTSSFSWTFKTFGSTSSGTSQLGAYKPTGSASTDQVLSFTGYATALAIGAKDRLFLIVGKKLYAIPTPFSTGTVSNLLERVAVDVTHAREVPAAFAAANALQVDLKSLSLDGSSYGIKVRTVGTKEYLYISTFTFTWSPYSSSSKILIIDADTLTAVRTVEVK